MSMDISPRRAVTVSDIAAAVGVHQSTASRALHGDLRIRPEIRDKVVKCAEELGYRPNPFVSALTAQVRSYRRSPNGAVLALLDFNPDERPYLGPYRCGAERRAREHGFNPEIFRLRDLDYSFKRLNQLLWTRSIFGVLVLPLPFGIDISGLQLARMASATVDTTVHTPALHRASPDYFQGMNLALEILEARGYKRITFCTNKLEVQLLDREWLGAFAGWQALKPKSARMEAFIGENWNTDSFKKWFQKHRPDAIVANCHPYFEACHQMGYHAPEVANAALNAGPDYEGVAGITQNPENIGAAAVDMIIAQIHRNEFGPAKLAKKMLIPGSWVEGATVRL